MKPNDTSQAADPAMSNSGSAKADERGWLSLFAAWAIATIATLGALFIGEVMGQTPCILCWYQRIFMFPLAVILGVAVFRSDYSVYPYAITLAGAGTLFAFYHSLIYAGIVSEALSPCSQGLSCASTNMTVFGILPLPILSLGAFAGIAGLSHHAKKESRS